MYSLVQETGRNTMDITTILRSGYLAASALVRASHEDDQQPPTADGKVGPARRSHTPLPNPFPGIRRAHVSLQRILFRQEREGWSCKAAE